jgi:hypothetical protein
MSSVSTSRLTAFVGFSVFCTALLSAGRVAAQEDLLIGSWACSAGYEEEGGSMSTEFTETFRADHTMHVDGEVKVDVDTEDFKVKTSFSIEISGTWRLEPMVLWEKWSNYEFELTSKRPSPMEETLVQQLSQSLQPEDEESDTKIVSLTATRMQLDDDGPVYCERLKD